jgi:hypothetical protein
MDFTIELAKGVLQYTPSYLATLIQFLTGPLKFLRTALTSVEKEEELKKALSFAFLTLVMLALLTGIAIEPKRFALYFIVEGIFKIMQVAALVAIMHLALRAVAVTADPVPLTAFALYSMSVGTLGNSIISIAFMEASEAVAFVALLFSPAFFAMCWTALYRALLLSRWQAVVSFVIFLTSTSVVGYVFMQAMIVLAAQFEGTASGSSSVDIFEIGILFT